MTPVPAYFLSNGMLLILQVLHLYWGYLIFKVLKKFLFIKVRNSGCGKAGGGGEVRFDCPLDGNQLEPAVRPVGEAGRWGWAVGPGLTQRVSSERLQLF